MSLETSQQIIDESKENVPLTKNISATNNSNTETKENVANEKNENFNNATLGAPPKSNRVVVKETKNKNGLRNYLIRAQRIIRLQPHCIIFSRSNACNVACEVVEILKKERVAQIAKIRTGIVENIEDPDFGQATLEILLKRGEYGHLVSDFRRRKIIEIFELQDEKLTGIILGEKIRQLQLPQLFFADEKRKKMAEDFLKKKDDRLNLPNWIHFCSILIHPLLLEFHFKTAINHLGGMVDVHDGTLPPNMTEEQIKYLERMAIYNDETDLKSDENTSVVDLDTFHSRFKVQLFNDTAIDDGSNDSQNENNDNHPSKPNENQNDVN